MGVRVNVCYNNWDYGGKDLKVRFVSLLTCTYFYVRTKIRKSLKHLVLFVNRVNIQIFSFSKSLFFIRFKNSKKVSWEAYLLSIACFFYKQTSFSKSLVFQTISTNKSYKKPIHIKIKFSKLSLETYKYLCSS